VSYILDALKKAAEQRDAHAPAMRRLFSPVPEFTESPRWRLAAMGGAVALAGAVVAVWALWPAPAVVVEKPAPPPATARVQPEAPPLADPAPLAPPVVRPAPKPAAPVKTAAERRPTPPAAVQTRQEPVESVVPAPALHARPAPVESARPQPTTPPPVIGAVRPAPLPAVNTAPAPAAPRAEAGGQLRLEVIVYSDERARRLAFINGRKYVEGDLLLDGTRIQEIQPNAVVIIDDGRRVLLKP
jgi:type II secretion system (T2SS) protein B